MSTERELDALFGDLSVGGGAARRPVNRSTDARRRRRTMGRDPAQLARIVSRVEAAAEEDDDIVGMDDIASDEEEPEPEEAKAPARVTPEDLRRTAVFDRRINYPDGTADMNESVTTFTDATVEYKYPTTTPGGTVLRGMENAERYFPAFHEFLRTAEWKLYPGVAFPVQEIDREDRRGARRRFGAMAQMCMFPSVRRLLAIPPESIRKYASNAVQLVYAQLRVQPLNRRNMVLAVETVLPRYMASITAPWPRLGARRREELVEKFRNELYRDAVWVWYEWEDLPGMPVLRDPADLTRPVSATNPPIDFVDIELAVRWNPAMVHTMLRLDHNTPLSGARIRRILRVACGAGDPVASLDALVGDEKFPPLSEENADFCVRRLIERKNADHLTRFAAHAGISMRLLGGALASASGDAKFVVDVLTQVDDEVMARGFVQARPTDSADPAFISWTDLVRVANGKLLDADFMPSLALHVGLEGFAEIITAGGERAYKSSFHVEDTTVSWRVRHTRRMLAMAHLDNADKKPLFRALARISLTPIEIYAWMGNEAPVRNFSASMLGKRLIVRGEAVDPYATDAKYIVSGTRIIKTLLLNHRFYHDLDKIRRYKASVRDRGMTQVTRDAAAMWSGHRQRRRCGRKCDTCRKYANVCAMHPVGLGRMDLSRAVRLCDQSVDWDAVRNIRCDTSSDDDDDVGGGADIRPQNRSARARQRRRAMGRTPERTHIRLPPDRVPGNQEAYDDEMMDYLQDENLDDTGDLHVLRMEETDDEVEEVETKVERAEALAQAMEAVEHPPALPMDVEDEDDATVVSFDERAVDVSRGNAIIRAHFPPLAALMRLDEGPEDADAEATGLDADDDEEEVERVVRRETTRFMSEEERERVEEKVRRRLRRRRGAEETKRQNQGPRWTLVPGRSFPSQERHRATRHAMKAKFQAIATMAMQPSLRHLVAIEPENIIAYADGPMQLLYMQLRHPDHQPPTTRNLVISIEDAFPLMDDEKERGGYIQRIMAGMPRGLSENARADKKRELKNKLYRETLLLWKRAVEERWPGVPPIDADVLHLAIRWNRDMIPAVLEVFHSTASLWGLYRPAYDIALTVYDDDVESAGPAVMALLNHLPLGRLDETWRRRQVVRTVLTEMVEHRDAALPEVFQCMNRAVDNILVSRALAQILIQEKDVEAVVSTLVEIRDREATRAYIDMRRDYASRPLLGSSTYIHRCTLFSALNGALVIPFFLTAVSVDRLFLMDVVDCIKARGKIAYDLMFHDTMDAPDWELIIRTGRRVGSEYDTKVFQKAGIPAAELVGLCHTGAAWLKTVPFRGIRGLERERCIVLTDIDADDIPKFAEAQHIMRSSSVVRYVLSHATEAKEEEKAYAHAFGKEGLNVVAKALHREMYRILPPRGALSTAQKNKITCIIDLWTKWRSSGASGYERENESIVTILEHRF